MGFLATFLESKILSVRRKRKAKFQRVTSDTLYLFNQICSALIHAAHECVRRISPLLHVDTDEERTFHRMQAHYEFVYFFTHMTSRITLSKFGAERRSKLCDIIFPPVALSAIDAFWSHQPVEEKKILRNHFYQGMKEADQDYGTGTEWLSREKPYLGDSLLSKLGRNVARGMGQEFNPETILQVTIAAADVMRSAKIPELVEATRRVIDHVKVIDFDLWDDPDYRA
jgi:hypothetical protein